MIDAYDPAGGRDVQGQLQDLLESRGERRLSQAEADTFAKYLDLLLRWNLKVNLTAVRDVAGILRRHFLESIFCARMLPTGITTLLDYGSGAGFPGVPCAICRADLKVTLAESQTKKATFLREAVRVLGLTTAVYHGRVEEMNADQRFDAVTLRAVEHMPDACARAVLRLKADGWIAILGTDSTAAEVMSGLSGVSWEDGRPLTGTDQRVLVLGRRLSP